MRLVKLPANKLPPKNANYFLMMLNVMAEAKLLTDEVFPVFYDLFKRWQLARSRRAIMNLGVHLGLKPLPQGLVVRFTCDSDETCKGHRRKSWLVWPLPGADDEYSMTHFCFFCRLDVEITWFLVRFRFMEKVGFWVSI